MASFPADDKKCGADDENGFGTPPIYEEDEAIVQTAYVTDHHAERALCRKFDLHLLPVLAVVSKTCEEYFLFRVDSHVEI